MGFSFLPLEKLSNSESMMQIKSATHGIENDDRQKDFIVDECHKNNDADRHYINYKS